MLTAAEKKALLLTVTFLLLGAGIKLWIRAKTELGPFQAPAALATAAPPEDTAKAGQEDSSGVVPPSAESVLVGFLPGDRAAPKVAAKEAKPRAKDKPHGKVDLNLASVETLAGVPGIGPKTAVAILEYRNSRGGIRDVRELLEVKGIGEKKLEKIRPWVLSSAGGVEAESAAEP